MKYLILRCEDLAPARDGTPSLIDAAKAVHLQHLSRAGAAGRVRPPGSHRVLDRFQLHRGLFGLSPGDPEAAAAPCYAASANVTPGTGEVPWCCELSTQHNGRIMDPTAGDIPTDQSRELIQMLNRQLGSDRWRWQLGENSHHVFVVRDVFLGRNEPFAIAPPELLVGRSWNRSLPKGPARDVLQGLLEQASALLEDHPINHVRVDLGENPANLVWLWGAAHGGDGKMFRERTGLSGLVVSTRFPMRGFAQCLGLAWEPGPKTLKEDPLRRLTKSIPNWLRTYDVVYVHLVIEHTDPLERLCAMERIDQLLLKPLTEHLSEVTPSRFLFAVDDFNRSVLFVAIGTGLAPQPLAHLTPDSFADSPLQFTEGSQVVAWFTKG